MSASADPLARTRVIVLIDGLHIPVVHRRSDEMDRGRRPSVATAIQ